MMHVMTQFIQTGSAAVGAPTGFFSGLVPAFLSSVTEHQYSPGIYDNLFSKPANLVVSIFIFRNMCHYNTCTHIFNRKTCGFEL